MNRILIAVPLVIVALALIASAPAAQDVLLKPAEVKPATDAAKEKRRAEGDQLLGSMRDMARVQYARSGTAPKKLTGKGPDGCGATKEELTGKFCKVHDKVYEVEGKPDSAAVIAEDFEARDGFGILKFEWAVGGRNIKWYDTLDALIEANEDVEIEDKTTTSGSDESDEPEEVKDPYALYKKLGRKWKHKNTTTIQGMDPIISYMEYEITEVTDTYCVQKMTMRDKDDKLMPGVEPFETRIEFRAVEDVEDAGGDAPELKRETKKVKAGEFECYVMDVGGSKSWMSVEYPGLLVKMEGGQTEVELIEFSDASDKSEDKPDKPAEDEGSKEADMSDYWERYVSTFKKGRTWTYEATAGVKIKNEVTEVTETKATVRITTLLNGNPIGDPTDTEYDLVQKDSDGAEDYEEIKWREKEIETKAGTFTGVSMDGEIWMMKKHPMILLKGAGTELVEFKDE